MKKFFLVLFLFFLWGFFSLTKAEVPHQNLSPRTSYPLPLNCSNDCDGGHHCKPTSPVPLPGSIVVLGGGLAILAYYKKTKK